MCKTRRTGKKGHIAKGSGFNFKITTKEDVEMFRKLVQKQ
jgi:2-C-methyl-D-erythritol 4-phosphate cytidylyltransferase